jgi:hypothetical protein
MPALRPDPDLFDLAAWRQRLAELQAEPQDAWRDAMIDHAEAHIAAISRTPEKSPLEAR